MATHRFFVLGNQAYSDTTVRLERGAYVMVRHVEGTVRFNISEEWGPEVGPNGYVRSDYEVHWRDDARFGDPLTGWHDGHAGLLALIDGRACFVGAKATFHSQLGGDLLLGINDSTTAAPLRLGNSGGFRVEVMVSKPDVQLQPLLGTWVKVGETPRRPGAPEVLLMSFDLDGTWRMLAPYSRETLEGGAIREVGSPGGQEVLKLRSEARKVEETWTFVAAPKRLVLRRVGEPLELVFDRL